jgi:hypothetical protein
MTFFKIFMTAAGVSVATSLLTGAICKNGDKIKKTFFDDDKQKKSK